MCLFPLVLLLIVTAAKGSPAAAEGLGCAPRDYGRGSVVCVCNATYCDSVPPVRPRPAGEAVLYSSSKAGLRFSRTPGLRFHTTAPDRTLDRSLLDLLLGRDNIVRVNSNVRYQSIIGWGATVTDSTGININALSDETREKIFQSYFSSEGIEYNLLRIPIGGTDCSTRKYTLNDEAGDVQLKTFSLSSEDWMHKIPVVKAAEEVSERPLKLIGSAWSAPPWMKTNKDYIGFGFLEEDMYQTWADYHIKFLDAYAAEGLRFWSITTGNEPNNALVGPLIKFNSMGWTPLSMRKWIGANLGPTLRNSNHSDVKILTLDDQRLNLPWWIDIVMADEEASKYIDGVALHWYTDYMTPLTGLSLIHTSYPNLFVLGTEASNGFNNWDEKVVLGSWDRAVSYFTDIMDDLSHWVTGWMEWSLVLSTAGGPSWSGNFVDTSILVDSASDEFLKQPTYYAVGHFSKFLPPGSERVQSKPEKVNGVRNIAFARPDGGKVVIFLNENDKEKTVTVRDTSRGFLTVTVAAHSFNTLLYW